MINKRDNRMTQENLMRYQTRACNSLPMISTISDTLTDPHLAIIIAYAPTGLGHLRVSRALRLGLPHEAEPILFPDTTQTFQSVHRYTSITPFGREIQMFFQYGQAEELMTRVFRWYLQKNTRHIEKKLLDILKERPEVPTGVIFVATHPGIAHQIAKIKHRVEKRAQVRLLLAVQVTDDTPQKIWYVPGADITFVPSIQTKQSLENYARNAHLPKTPMVVSPYPVSPSLAQTLPPQAFRYKIAQAHSTTRPIHFAVPISGAAAGIEYLSTLMKHTHAKLPQARFHVVTKRTFFTKLYINRWENRPYISVSHSYSDRQVVELYEQMYKETAILAEITKPSEQAFKAQLSAERRGGSILLFADPVGRQEFDNLAFLRRHRLIPSEEENQELFNAFLHHKKPPLTLFHEASNWRGLVTPKDAKRAGSFIAWAHKEKLFAQMVHAAPCSRNADPSCHMEVSAFGTHLFWKRVGEMVEK